MKETWDEKKSVIESRKKERIKAGNKEGMNK
jgi:hypothetical protein